MPFLIGKSLVVSDADSGDWKSQELLTVIVEANSGSLEISSSVDGIMRSGFGQGSVGSGPLAGKVGGENRQNDPAWVSIRCAICTSLERHSQGLKMRSETIQYPCKSWIMQAHHSISLIVYLKT